jgi:phosphoglycolate phosphatase
MSRHIYFDLDGTLTDPSVGITRCIQHALKRVGVQQLPKEQLLRCIGPPLHDSIAHLVGDARAETALAHYRNRFVDIGWQENRVYGGVLELLGQLVNLGHTLYVATSKPAIFANRILRHFELSNYFRGVYGAELDGTRSDKAELLRFALHQQRSNSATIMVGDRQHDIVAALANDIAAIGVTYGFGSLQELRAAGAERVAATPAELADLLR